jgi:hypothetical protein
MRILFGLFLLLSSLFLFSRAEVKNTYPSSGLSFVVARATTLAKGAHTTLHTSGVGNVPGRLSSEIKDTMQASITQRLDGPATYAAVDAKMGKTLEAFKECGQTCVKNAEQIYKAAETEGKVSSAILSDIGDFFKRLCRTSRNRFPSSPSIRANPNPTGPSCPPAIITDLAERQVIAEAIGSGHALTKHPRFFEDLHTPAERAQPILDIIDSAIRLNAEAIASGSHMRHVVYYENGRISFWDGSDGFVHFDPVKGDMGTAFHYDWGGSPSHYWEDEILSRSDIIP